MTTRKHVVDVTVVKTITSCYRFRGSVAWCRRRMGFGVREGLGKNGLDTGRGREKRKPT